MLESVPSVRADLTLQDRVLVEADLGGQIVGFRVVVVRVCPNEVWLGLPASDSRLEGMGQGKRLRLTATRHEGALVAQSRFLRHLSRGRIFAVEIPSVVENVQRRSHRRVSLELEVRLRLFNAATGMLEGKAYSGRTIDVSTGGLLLQTDMPLTIGDELEVRITLAGSERVTTTARVTSIRDLAGGAGASTSRDSPGAAIGLKYSHMTAVDQNRILRYILIAEQRKREAFAEEPSTPMSIEPDWAPGTEVAAPQAADTEVAVEEAPARAPVARAPVAPAPVAPARAFRQTAVASESEPLIAVGLRLCEAGDIQAIRCWFDSLGPGDRIGVLCRLHENMAGAAVPGASEPGAVSPLVHALGLS